MEEAIIQRASSLNIFRLLLKHWLMLLTIILLIPALISITATTIKENNYLYPVYSIGTLLIGADNILNNGVNLLRDNPDKLIGMAHPDSGLWQHIKYYWLFFFNVIWAFMLEIHLIFLPFYLMYLAFKSNNNSTTGKNVMFSALIVLIFMFVVNTIFTIDNILNGVINISIPTNLSSFEKFIFIGTNLLPFHGLGNLIMYLIQLFI